MIDAAGVIRVADETLIDFETSRRHQVFVQAEDNSEVIQDSEFEIDVLNAPHRNPYFYLDQTLGSLFEILIVSSPVTPERARNIVVRLEAIPWSSELVEEKVGGIGRR